MKLLTLLLLFFNCVQGADPPGDMTIIVEDVAKLKGEMEHGWNMNTYKGRQLNID